MKTFLALAFSAALAIGSTACGSTQPASAAKEPAQEITINAYEMAFSPTTVEVNAGQPVKVTLKNTGAVEHNWQTSVGNETILVTTRPGQSSSKTFTPRTPGTYEVVCSVPGHAMAGMKGTLVVR